MNRKRLGQFLIGGVFTACAAVIAALVELVSANSKRENDAPAPKDERRDETGS